MPVKFKEKINYDLQNHLLIRNIRNHSLLVTMNPRKEKALRELREKEEQKHKVYNEHTKVIGFWHICMINNYVEIITEQLQLLVSSGLYEKASGIFVGCAGTTEDFMKTVELFIPYPKIKLLSCFPVKEYEFPTLKMIRSEAETEEDFFAFYIHTKAVTFPKSEGGKHWRDYMNYYIITQWEESFNKLRSGFDTCGVKLLQKGTFPTHYSGNFWWAKNTYIKRLATIDSLNKKDRFEAEMWLCKNKPNASSLCNKFVDYNTKGKFIADAK